MRRLLAILAIAGLFVGAVSMAAAQSGGMKGMDMKDMDMKGMDKGAKKATDKSHHAAGKVKSVDAAKGTVTIDHGPVASMKWPAMTMTFKAKDRKMLEAVKPGQNIEFDFEQQGKDHVITKVK
jgi:Cu(I)/Ag(I) efflux system periplasmic protein CusF